MLVEKIRQLGQNLNSFLSDFAEAANQEVKVIKRNRVFTATTLAQAFILAYLKNPNANEKDVAAMASNVGADVSPQAVEQRYSDDMAQFFEKVFSKLAQQSVVARGSIGKLLDRFTDVYAIDSSAISLPACMADRWPGCGGGSEDGSGNEAAVKLQTELDLKTGAIRCLQLEPGRSPDNASDRQNVDFQRGSLRLADLGYFSLSVLAAMTHAGAHFVSRVQYQTRIKIGDNWISVIDHFKTLSTTQRLFDFDVVLGKYEQMTCRMIAWKVPPNIAAKRRKTCRALAKKHGKTPSANALAACDWNMLVTDMPQADLLVEEAIVLYRSRWQIELLFKRWKTFCKIDLIDGRTQVHQRCRFWIRLCAALLQQNLVSTCCWNRNTQSSFAQCVEHLRSFVPQIAANINSLRGQIANLKKFADQANRIFKVNKRKKKPSWFQLIEDVDRLEFALT